MGHEAYASSTAKPEAPNRDRPEGGFPSRSTYHSALRIALPDEHQLSHDVFA